MKSAVILASHQVPGRKRTAEGSMKSAAILTIKKPGTMTHAERRDIVLWLRRQATNFQKHGHLYNDTGNYMARYYYHYPEKS